jgi:tRNA (cmo5U34)-methyltransferase
MVMPLEEMASFFNARIDEYEARMLRIGKTIYTEIARLIPHSPGLKLLDLGCGTGLELDEIFKVNPTVQVTGIDMAEKLLKKLSRKHVDKKGQLNLVLADYLNYDFGENVFDIALSVQTLHHFTREVKVELYRKILTCLKPDGFYLESDYYAPDQAFEDFRIAESRRLREEQGITTGHYHYDIPHTKEKQVAMLKEAGFKSVETVNPRDKGAILVARK